MRRVSLTIAALVWLHVPAVSGDTQADTAGPGTEMSMSDVQTRSEYMRLKSAIKVRAGIIDMTSLGCSGSVYPIRCAISYRYLLQATLKLVEELEELEREIEYADMSGLPGPFGARYARLHAKLKQSGMDFTYLNELYARPFWWGP